MRTAGKPVHYLTAAIVAGGLALCQPAMAAGNLAVRCEELPKLTFGIDDIGYKVSQAEYDLETGKCYKLEVGSTGNKEYAIRGPAFFHNVWLRKVEAGGAEIKAHSIFELEFENEGAVEMFFVPITTGSFTLGAAGMEDKGAMATFKVK